MKNHELIEDLKFEKGLIQSAKQQYYAQKAAKRERKKKTIFTIVIVLAVLLVAGAAIFGIVKLIQYLTSLEWGLPLFFLVVVPAILLICNKFIGNKD